MKNIFSRILLVIWFSTLVVYFSGCSNGIKSNDFFKSYEYKCIDGTKYLIFSGFGDRSGITTVLDENGKPIKCNLNF